MEPNQITVLDRCPPLSDIRDRTIIGPEQATELEAVFKVLANATRLRMLHALVREPGLSVGELARAIGMKPQAVSNQLRRLVDRGIVTPQRNGNNIHYRIVDACTITLLDYGLCLAVCTAEGGVTTIESAGPGATTGAETRQEG